MKDIKEVKLHVYGKREFVPRDQGSRLLFIISTHKLAREWQKPLLGDERGETSAGVRRLHKN